MMPPTALLLLQSKNKFTTNQNVLPQKSPLKKRTISKKDKYFYVIIKF